MMITLYIQTSKNMVTRGVTQITKRKGHKTQTEEPMKTNENHNPKDVN